MRIDHPVLAPLRFARINGLLRDVDLHLARHLLALTADPAPALALAIALLSRAQADGDTCLDLANCAGRTAFGNDTAPALADWRAALQGSGIVGRHDADGLPLVLDDAHRLYFARYFAFERMIATALLARADEAPLADDDAIEATLTAQFGTQPDPQQLAAARVALRRRLAVITGGPGTGKTTTVTKILAALQELAVSAGQRPPRIRLAAPTGKAAQRLAESIRTAQARMLAEGRDAARVATIPDDTSTLHRLIGMRPDTHRPRHDADNPLALDVLVIDEASMIDVPLMARVVAALPAHARLVLLGDADQLASVEAGAVLGDICRHSPTAATPMAGSVARLVTSHRFRGDGGIGALARAINAGDPEATLAACAGDPATRLVADAGVVPAQVIDRCVESFRHCLAAGDVAEAMNRFAGFRVLCALRDGERGVSGVNARVIRALAGAGLADTRETHWHGRPLLVTANDYGVQLFNGDIGLVWPDENGMLRACFVAADGTVRRLPLNRLPAHETAFAMTVHKSQGSEFDSVALVLPEADSPVLTRELVYTAVTRARSAVDIHSTPDLLAAAVGRRVQRSSGLRDALWGHTDH